jgi:hypothetical protein
MPPFDMRPVTESLGEFGGDTAKVYERLGETVRIDDRGGVEFDEREAQTVLEQSVPDAFVEPSLAELRAVAATGVARLETSAVPWLAIEDFSYAVQGLPAGMRRELGVEGATSPDEARERLKGSFPNAPEEVFAERGSELLLRDPLALPPVEPPDGGNGFDPSEPRPSRPQGGRPARVLGGITLTVSGIVPPSPEKAREAAECLLKGSWDGLVRGASVFGFNPTWVLGWSVCLDQACADKLADLLISLGGGAILLDAVSKAFAAGIAAAVNALVALPASAVLALYGLLLGALIKALNGPSGVCIHGNWPVVGGPGAFVWALRP